MVDAGVRGLRDLRLGVIGDAETRLAQHFEIIGAVSDRERRFDARRPSSARNCASAAQLAFAALDRREERRR